MKPRSSLFAVVLTLLVLGSSHPPSANAQTTQAFFRISIIGIHCTTPTPDSRLSVDGAGDEIAALANVVEVSSANTIVARQVHQSVKYGDMSGHAEPASILPGLEHDVFRMKAGTASATGGIQAGDRIPDPSATPRTISLTRQFRARLIPMVVWEGHLRRGGPTANAVLILPTVWELDNVRVLRTVWDAQADGFLGRLAGRTSAFVAGTERRQLVVQSEIALRWIPNQAFFDRPIGMSGGYFNPVAADAPAGTFIPAVMALNFDSAAEAATSRARGASARPGVVDIVYKDADDYGAANYTISVLIERLSF